MARWALPRSRAVAAPASGLGGSGKILLEGKGFPQGVLVKGAQRAGWVRGAAAQGWGSQGTRVLHAQGMLWGTVGLAPVGSQSPRPWQGSGVGGHGGRSRDTVGTEGSGRARRWICKVGGGRGSRQR